MDGQSQQQPQPQPAPAPPPPPPPPADQSSTSQPKLTSSTEGDDSDLIPDSVKNNICFKIACGAALGLVDAILPPRESLPPMLSQGPLAPKADTTVETTRGTTQEVATSGMIAAAILAIKSGLGGLGVGGVGAAGAGTASAVVASPLLIVGGILLGGWAIKTAIQSGNTLQMAKSKGGTGSGETPPTAASNPPGTPPSGPQTPPIPPKVLKDAKKFNLNAESPTSRQILDNLEMDVQEFISNYRKAGIEGVFPGEYLEKGVKLRDALKEGGSTVRKLLTDGRFTK